MEMRPGWTWSTNCRRPKNEAASRVRQATLDESSWRRCAPSAPAYLDRLARLQAEFDNFRKRSAKEQQDFRDYALADALKSLLPILDSLDRALKTNAASVQDFHSGIELIDKQFHDALARLGVEPIPAAGRSVRSQSAPGGPDGGHRRGRRQPRDR